MRLSRLGIASAAALVACSPAPPPVGPPPPKLAALAVVNTSVECVAPRAVTLQVDGTERADLAPGQRAELQLEVGAHQLTFGTRAGEVVEGRALELPEGGAVVYHGCADPGFFVPGAERVAVRLVNEPHGCDVEAHGHAVWRLDGRHLGGLEPGRAATRYVARGVHTLTVAVAGHEAEKTRLELGGDAPLVLAVGCTSAARGSGLLLPLTVYNRVRRGCAAPRTVVAAVAGRRVELEPGHGWTVLLPRGVHRVAFVDGAGADVGPVERVELRTRGVAVERPACVPGR